MGKEQTIQQMEEKIRRDLLADEVNRGVAVVQNNTERNNIFQRNLNALLQKRMEHKAADGTVRVIEGQRNDPEKGTLGIFDVFDAKEFYGKPFCEVSRNMANHFKMYCLVHGVTDKEMLTMAQEEPPQKTVEKLLALKKDFYDMVVNKDMDAITDYYVGIANYAGSKLPAIMACENLAYLENNADNMLLIDGSASYLQQTLHLNGYSDANITAEQKELVSRVNARLKEEGKLYTLNDVEDGLFPVDYLTDSMPKGNEGTAFKDVNYEQLDHPDFNDDEYDDIPGALPPKERDVIEKMMALTRGLREAREAMEKDGLDYNIAFAGSNRVFLAGKAMNYRNDVPWEDRIQDVLGKVAPSAADLSRQLQSSTVSRFFITQDDPKEFTDLVEAAKQVEKREQAIFALQHKGKNVSLSDYERLEAASRRLQETAQTYLDMHEPESGDLEKRFRLVVQARMLAQNNLQRLERNAPYAAFTKERDKAAAILDEAVEINHLHHSLNSAFDEILDEPYTFTDDEGKEITVAGSYNDKEKGTFGTIDIFGEHSAYYGKPFKEVSRNMGSHFKAYCVSRGMDEQELLSIARNGATEEQKSWMRDMKKDFFDMVVHKDMDKISDMYVNLALQVDADHDRFAALKPGTDGVIREDPSFILKYSGNQSWFDQSIAHGTRNQTLESKQLVDTINAKLKEQGKTFTYGNLLVPMKAVEGITQCSFAGDDKPASRQLTDGSTASLAYTYIYGATATLQDHMGVSAGKDWLSIMPETVSEVDEALASRLGTEYAEMMTPFTAKPSEKTIAAAMQATLAQSKMTYETAKNNLADDLEEISEEPEFDFEETENTLKEIAASAGDQQPYLDLFAAAGVRYPLHEIAEDLQDEEAVKLHEQSADMLRNRAADAKRLSQFKVADPRFKRIAAYFLDPSDTPEAQKKNEEFIKEINTPEGATAFANRLTKQLLDTDPAELIPTNVEDMARKYMEDPNKYDLLFAAGDIVNEPNGLSKIEEPFFSALKEKHPMLQAGGGFKIAAQLMAHSQWATFSQPSLTLKDIQALIPAASFMVPDAVKGGAPYAQDLAQLPGIMTNIYGAFRDKKILEAMEDSSLLKDNATLMLGGKAVTRDEVQVKARDDISVIDRVSSVPHSPEQMASLNKAVADLPKTAQDVKEQAPYKEMISFHAGYFKDAELPLPSPAELKAKSEDPEKRALHERAKAFYAKNASDLNRLKEQFSADVPASLNRVYWYLLDTSGTMEAAEKNRHLQAVASTPEGQKLIMNYAVKTLMNTPTEFFLPHDMEEAAKNYLDHPDICKLGWVCGDLVSDLKNPDSPLHLDEPLLSAFLNRQKFFTAAAACDNAANLMARDDWAMFDRPDLTDEKAMLLMASRSSDHRRPDPYAVIPVDEVGKPVAEMETLLGSRGSVMAEVFRGSELSKVFFAPDSDLALNGKPITPGDALTRFRDKGVEGISFSKNPNWKEAEKQLQELNSDFRNADIVYSDRPQMRETEAGTKGRTSSLGEAGSTSRTASVGETGSLSRTASVGETGSVGNKKAGADSRGIYGKALQEDMRAIYNSLDDVNHGAFISSPQFNDVLHAVQNMTRTVLSQDQAREAMNQIIAYANTYITGKEAKASLKTREVNRLAAVRNVKEECETRLKIMDARHRTGEAMRDALRTSLRNQAEEHVKSADELYDEETARMPEGSKEKKVRELIAKYRISPSARKEAEEFGNTPAELPAKEDILARLEDTKVQDLHDRALRMKQYHEYCSAGDSKGTDFLCGFGDPSAARMGLLLMDPTSTPEAEEHNRLLGAALSTPEGCRQLYATVAHRLMTDKNVDAFLKAETMEDFLKAYEDHPRLGELVFLTQEMGLANFMKQLDDPLKTAYADKQTAFQIGRIAGPIIDYLASDVFLAFGETDIRPENASRWTEIANTVRASGAESKTMIGELSFLNIMDASMPKAYQKMKQDMFRPEIYFEDDSGKHLNLQEAATTLASKRNVHAKSYQGEQLEKLNAQIRQLNVSEPLDLGRQVLEGRKEGISGIISEESFRRQVAEMQKSLEELSQRHPGETHPLLDQSRELLQKMSKAPAGTPEEIQNNFTAIRNVMHQPLRADNELTRELGVWMTKNDVQARNSANLAHMMAGHEVFSLTQPDNGLKAFRQSVLEPDNGLPQSLKQIASDGLQLMADCDGMQYQRLPEEKQQQMAKGVAAALLLNQLTVEQDRDLGAKPNSLTKLMQERPEISNELCDAMARSKEIRKECSYLSQSADNLRTMLSDPVKMMASLKDYMTGNQIGKMVEGAKEKAQQRIAKEQQVCFDRVRKGYQDQQKLLGEMLNAPEKFVADAKAESWESMEQAQNRTFVDKMKKCVATMVACKQTEEFITENRGKLSSENMSAVSSSKSIQERASRIEKTPAMDLMMTANSPLMRKNAICKLAIGAEKVMNPKAENGKAPTELSERAVTEVTKRIGMMTEKEVKPLNVKDFPAKQAGGMMR